MDFSPTLIACRTASERARLPDGMDACHGLATSPQRASWTTRPADAKRVFRRLCTPRARPASPRTGAGPDGRAGSTALRSAAWGPPACAAGLMRSTRAHGAGIAAIAAIRLSPRGTAHQGGLGLFYGFERSPIGKRSSVGFDFKPGCRNGRFHSEKAPAFAPCCRGGGGCCSLSLPWLPGRARVCKLWGLSVPRCCLGPSCSLLSCTSPVQGGSPAFLANAAESDCRTWPMGKAR